MTLREILLLTSSAEVPALTCIPANTGPSGLTSPDWFSFVFAAGLKDAQKGLTKKNPSFFRVPTYRPKRVSTRASFGRTTLNPHQRIQPTHSQTVLTTNRAMAGFEPRSMPIPPNTVPTMAAM